MRVHWRKEGREERAGWHPSEAASRQSRVLGRVCILSRPQPCWSGTPVSPPDTGNPSLARIWVPQESGELAGKLPASPCAMAQPWGGCQLLSGQEEAMAVSATAQGWD